MTQSLFFKKYTHWLNSTICRDGGNHAELAMNRVDGNTVVVDFKKLSNRTLQIVKEGEVTRVLTESSLIDLSPI